MKDKRIDDDDFNRFPQKALQVPSRRSCWGSRPKGYKTKSASSKIMPETKTCLMDQFLPTVMVSSVATLQEGQAFVDGPQTIGYAWSCFKVMWARMWEAYDQENRLVRSSPKWIKRYITNETNNYRCTHLRMMEVASSSVNCSRNRLWSGKPGISTKLLRK